MDPAAFATLVERCASPAMAAPLTAIVQQASSFEPFLITLGERKPIRLQATDRNEAIQLATEAAATGKPVRIGLGQLDREEMKLAGLTIATTFDACQHVAGLGRLFQVRFQTAIADRGDPHKATPGAIKSFAMKDKPTMPQGSRAPSPPPADEPAANFSSSADLARERPSWDVYRAGLGTSAFVYGR
ncbi:type IV secretion protein [Bradyrhizobium denitrificans]|uniref:type IV secretion protein n=1 Tax=Bradyrhizobium denitrificans TaxID=2734912 RepID=UPI0015521628|nr:type IV secretion protein [Bradyrhizobium sp. LMG 8443]NPU25706.1 type IV secretion protein [Bradyrhizobium sp. LMG 8443]